MFLKSIGRRVATTALVVALLPTLSIADSTTFLNSGQVAPFTGYLITREKAGKIYNLGIELDSQKKITALLIEEQQIYVQRLNNAHQENEILSKQVVSQKDKSFFDKAAFFVLGAVLTGVISYGLTRSIR